jgi:hypothetical protein
MTLPGIGIALAITFNFILTWAGTSSVKRRDARRASACCACA